MFRCTYNTELSRARPTLRIWYFIEGFEDANMGLKLTFGDDLDQRDVEVAGRAIQVRISQNMTSRCAGNEYQRMLALQSAGKDAIERVDLARALLSEGLSYRKIIQRLRT